MQRRNTLSKASKSSNKHDHLLFNGVVLLVHHLFVSGSSKSISQTHQSVIRVVGADVVGGDICLSQRGRNLCHDATFVCMCVHRLKKRKEWCHTSWEPYKIHFGPEVFSRANYRMLIPHNSAHTVRSPIRRNFLCNRYIHRPAIGVVITNCNQTTCTIGS